jgi:hypothetical protein
MTNAPQKATGFQRFFDSVTRHAPWLASLNRVVGVSGSPSQGQRRGHRPASAQREFKQRMRMRNCLLEALEPRQLLAADFWFDAATESREGFDLTLSTNGFAIQLSDALTGVVVKSQPIADNSGTIIVAGSSESETLTIDDSVRGFSIEFHALAGSDALKGPATNATWSVDGVGAGWIDDFVRFTGVEHLVGAADNEDTFVIKPGGGLLGGVDGGPAGFDSLILDGGSYQDVIYTASGPSDGRLILDGVPLVYRGLEPTTLSATMANLTIDADDSSVSLSLIPGADNLVLENAPTAGRSILRNADPANPTIEEVTFANPTEKLTIKLGLGNDTLTVNSLDPAFAAALTVEGQSGDDSVVFAGDITLPGKDLTVDAERIGVGFAIANLEKVDDWTPSAHYANRPVTATGGTAGTGMTVHVAVNHRGVPTVTLANPGSGYKLGDVVQVAEPSGSGTPLEIVALGTGAADVTISTRNIDGGGVSQGNSGKIELKGEQIALGQGAELLADVSVGSSHDAGSITIEAANRPHLADSLALDILSPFAKRGRTSVLSVTDAKIQGGDITLKATGATLTRWEDQGDYAEGIAGGLLDTLAAVPQLGLSLLSAISGQVKIHHAHAGIELSDAVIVGAGDVQIQAEAETNASFTTVGINRIAGDSRVVISFGYGEADSTAMVTVGGTTQITAAGNIDIDATAKSDAEATSRVSANARASGSVEGDAKVEFAASIAAVKTAENANIVLGPSTVLVSQQGSIDIDAVGEVSNAPSSESAVFQDGHGAFSIAVGVDHADVTADVYGTVQALNPSSRGKVSFDASQATAVNVANNSLTLTGIPQSDKFTLGQKIVYDSGGHSPLGNLADGATYYVVEVTDGAVDDANDTITQTIKLASLPGMDLDPLDSSGNTSVHSLSRLAVLLFPASGVSTAPGDLTISGLSGVASGDKLIYRGPNSEIDQQIEQATFAALGALDTITTTSGPTWRSIGLHVGQTISLVDTNEDDGDYTVTAISPDGRTLTMTGAERLTPTPAGQFEKNFNVTSEAGVGVPGLVQGTEYEIDFTGGAVRFKDPENAGQFVQLDVDADPPTGVHGFQYFDEVSTFSPATDVDGGLELVALPGHNFQTGDLVVYKTDPTKTLTSDVYELTGGNPRSSRGQVQIPDAPLPGLKSGQGLYVVRVDGDHIKLAATPLAARQSVPAEFGGLGTGQHALLAESLATGVGIRASLEATNSADAGVALSDEEQPWPDLLNGVTNPETLATGVRSLVEKLQAAGKTATETAQNESTATQDKKSEEGVDLAGTIAISVPNHQVLATVGSTATVQSGRDLIVSATINQQLVLKSVSEATRNATDGGDDSDEGGGSDTEISVAIGVGVYTNRAEAKIADDATIDASGTLSVVSKVEYPLLADSINQIVNPVETMKESGLDGLEFLLDGTGGIGSGLFNVWGSALAGDPGDSGADKLAIGATVMVTYYDNDSLAAIGHRAAVNQDVALQTEDQAVVVDADTVMNIIEVGHNASFNLSIPGLIEAGQGAFEETGGRGAQAKGFFQSLLNPFGVSGKSSIGPVALFNIANNTTVAEIKSDAQVRTGKKSHLFDPTTGGVIGGDHAIDLAAPSELETGDAVVYEVPDGGAAVGGLKDGQTYYAIVDPATPDKVKLAASPAEATAGTAIAFSAGAAGGAEHRLLFKGRLSVTADQDIFNVAAAQTGAQASSLGIGASITVGVALSTTRANLGENVTVSGGPLQVLANDQLDRVAVAGAFLAGKQTGIGISVGVNVTDRDVLAYIGREDTAPNATAPPAANIDVAGPVEVLANMSGDLFSLVMAGAFQGSKNEAEEESGDVGPATASQQIATKVTARQTKAIAITVPVAVNVLTHDVRAYVDRQNIKAGSVDVKAGVAVSDQAVVVGASFAVQKGTTQAGGDGSVLNIAGAGSVAVNIGRQVVDAFIKDSTIVTDGGAGVRVAATDTSRVEADGGGFGFALSKSEKGGTNVSFGGSFAFNDLNSQTRAVIDRSSVTAHRGDVRVVADIAPTIRAVTIGGAVSAGAGGDGTNASVAMAGAASFNQIGDEDADAAVAKITSSTIDVKAGNVAVQATDRSRIHADAGGVAISFASGRGKGTTATGSIGVSLAFNEITNKTAAVIDASKVDAQGSVLVAAEFASPLTKSLDFAPAAVNATTEAITLTEHGLATGDRVIYRSLGGPAQSVGGLEDGRRYYVIRVDDNQIRLAATETQAKEEAPIAINLSSPPGGSSHRFETANPNIDALAVAGSAGVSAGQGNTGAFSGAGAGSRNLIRNTIDAHISNSRAEDGRGIQAKTGDVAVTALDAASIHADVIGASVAVAAASGSSGNAGTLTIGVSIARNEIDNDVTAYVDRATVTTPTGGGDITIDVVEDANISAVSVAASIAVSASNQNAVALSGGGAEASNVILTRANSFARDSRLSSARDVDVRTVSTSDIDATVVAVSASVGAGNKAAASASIGAARARNFIGYRLDGTEAASQSQAYLQDVSVGAARDLQVVSLATQAIDSGVGAGSVAVSASGKNAGGLSGAGVETNNKIRVLSRAFIDGDDPLADNAGPQGISARSVTVTADDTSSISARAGAASLAVAAAGNNALALSIGVSLARNEVDNDVQASIADATVTTTSGGDVLVKATSQGRKLFELAASTFAAGLDDAATVTDDDDDTSGVNEAEVDVAADVAFLRTLRTAFEAKGYALPETGFDFESDEELDELDRGTRIKLKSGATGGTAGAVFQYVGGSETGTNLLAGQNYADTDKWKPVDDVTVTATQPDEEWSLVTVDGGYVIRRSGPLLEVFRTTIQAVSVAASVAVGFGGQNAGIALSGAGAESTNTILSDTKAFIDASAITSAGDVDVLARDTSGIIATVVGASAAVGIGGKVGGAASIGVAVSRNMIGNFVDANASSAYTTAAQAPPRLEKGDTVKVSAGARAGDIFEWLGDAADMYDHTSADGQTTLNEDDLVILARDYDPAKGVGGFVYRYTGTSAASRNLTDEDYTGGAWEQVGSGELATQDFSNRSLWRQTNHRESPSNVLAYVQDSSVHADSGDITLDAVADSSISTVVVAASAAIAGGGNFAGALSGAGVSTENIIAVYVKAFIDGDGSGTGAGITGDSLSITAGDTSSIRATAVGASLAASFAGTGALALSVGVSLASNQINNLVEAYIANADDGVTTDVGGITIHATESASITAYSIAASAAIAGAGSAAIGLSGAGATATNVIATDVHAFVRSSVLDSAGEVDIDASNVSQIDATVAAASLAFGVAGDVGIGLSIGVGLATNAIGYQPDGRLDYAEVHAFIQDSSVQADGDVIVKADNEATIDAFVLAASAAAAGGLYFGLALAGAGVGTENLMAADVQAYIDGDGAAGISADRITVAADDNSTIRADSATVAVAASVALAGASISFGAAVAENKIANRIRAFVRNAAGLEATVGDVTVDADERSSIRANTVTASAAASISIGGAAAAAVTEAKNTLQSTIDAFIDNSDVQAAGKVAVDADDTATIRAEIDAFALSGGLVSLAVGVSLSDTTITDNVSAYINDSRVTASGGDISVTADFTPTITTTNIVGAVSFGLGGAGAGGDANTTINGTNRAYVDDAQLSAVGHDVLVQATSTSTATPQIDGLSGGLVAVGAMFSNVVVDGETQAAVRGLTTVTADKFDVLADDTVTAKPKTNIVAVGGISGAGGKSTSTLSRRTSALIDDSADLIAGATPVNVIATTDSETMAEIFGGLGGAAAISVIFVEATSDGTTRAAIGQDASVRTSGAVVVRALSDNTVDAKIKSVGVGLGLNVAVSNPTATDESKTEAAMLGSITGAAPGQGPASVLVEANASDVSSAGSEADGGGLISVTTANVKADTKPTVTATVDGTVRAAGNVTIQSISATDADAASRSASGGAVDIGSLNANAELNPTVTTEIRPGSILETDGTLTITSQHGQLPTPFSDGSFDGAADVDPTGNTITLSAKHGLLTGDLVTYDAGAGTVVSGLADDRQYGVIVAGDQVLQLGSVFNSVSGTTTQVDVTRDEIRFSTPHRLADGDRVIYQPQAGAAAVGGLFGGTPYQVRKLDDTTIKLIDPAQIPAAAKDFAGADVAADTITIAGHGFSNGQPVTYRAPQQTPLTVASVSDADNTIKLGPGHGFAAGDEVIYQADDSVIGGLAQNGRYFVIFDPGTPDVIKLAETLEEAIGDPGDAGAEPPVPPTAITPIDLVPSTGAEDKFDIHRLFKVTDQPIGGLTDGVTYYVANATTDTFRLALDPTGTSLVSLVNHDAVNPAVILTGTSSIGTEGIDLTDPGTGRHNLVIDITADGSGAQTLLGVGGARALAGAPSGDGIPTASASGTGGGVVRVSGATTNSAAAPAVSTSVGGNVQLRAFDILVDAHVIANATASSANSGGGAVSVGSATSSIDLNATGTTTIGAGASLIAVNDVTVTSRTNETGDVLADSSGGGVVDFAKGEATVRIGYNSTVDVQGHLSAGENVTVTADSRLKAKATATADSAGLGADATADAILTVGKQDTNSTIPPAMTRTVIGSNAALSGKNVDISATVSSFAATADSDATAGALGADTDSTAEVNIFNDVTVSLLPGAAVTGDIVKILSNHRGVDLLADALADCDCGAGAADANAKVDYNSDAKIDAQDGAKVSALDLLVEAEQVFVRYDRVASADVAVIGSETENETGELNAGRVIDWNADVALRSGVSGSPELLIDANGTIVTAVDITVNGGLVQGDIVPGGAASVSIDPIINNRSAGVAVLRAKSLGSLDGKTPPLGEIKGSTGTFSAATAFSNVQIDNRFAKPLVINAIDVVNLNGAPSITLDANALTLEFDIDNLVPTGTDVVITNNAATNVLIQDVINNPVGSTTIDATGGSLTTAGAGLVRSKDVKLNAGAGAVGSSGDPLAVELVRTDWGPTSLDVDATSSVDLNLQGLLRDTNPSMASFDNGSIHAGGDVDVQFGTVVQQITPIAGSSSGGANVTATQQSSLNGNYKAHFQPDPNPLPNIPRDFRAMADTSQSTPIDGSYRFNAIVGTNITLLAAQPAAGSPKVHLQAATDVGDTGDIRIVTNGNIDLDETSGDLRIDLIRSNAGDVHLTTSGVNASIFEIAADDGSTPFVIGNNVSLTASGGIGSLNDFLEIDSSHQASGVVNARARGGVFLTETSGDLNLDAVVSDRSDVILRTLDGSILEAVHDDAADIQGRIIELYAPQGAIGSASNPIDIYGAGSGHRQNSLQITAAVPDNGQLVALAENDIHLHQVNAALNVLRVDSASGDIGLSVLDTVLGNANFDGPFGEDFNLLPAGGVTLLGAAVGNAVVSAAGGSVEISAGDDVNIPEGTLVLANAAVTIRGDFVADQADDPDPNVGTVITIAGDVRAPQVVIEGGFDLDDFQLLGSTGINAAGQTTLRGHVSDDRFFIQAVAGPMRIEGGAGADRYYVSSNAAKSVFESQGFFDDGEVNVDHFALLGGTLANVADTLTIETGAGGNGGTRDVIRAGSGGSLAPVSGTIESSPVAGLGALTGLGMTGRIDFSAPAGESAFVIVGLGQGDDTFRVKSLANNIIAYVQGRDGDDTLNVGNDDDLSHEISGIVAFFGEDGTDTLNVFGDATAGLDPITGVDPDQLSAISVTGLGMGRTVNQLFSTHHFFGAGYDFAPGDTYPAAIYYGARTTSVLDPVTSVDTFSSTVEKVVVQLGDGHDTLLIDSIYDASFGMVEVRGGDGDDTFTVSSTITGLYPNSPQRVDFINGPLSIFGEGGSNTILVDDSGDENINVGTFQGATVTGLDMAGSITFDSADVIEILLGAQDDTFYVPSTSAGLTTTLKTGGGFDTVYLGTVEGFESSGTLDNFLGDFLIEGQGPEANDTLYFNDQDNEAGRTITVSNNPLDGTVPVQIGEQIVQWPIDTTTVSLGAAEIRYRTMETVVINAGGGNDVINVHSTHREQAIEGANSTFSINGGGGDDTVNLGAPTGAAPIEKYSLASFAIDIDDTPDPASIKGIPVLINGQAGSDRVHFLDSARIEATNLVFAQREFAEMFPDSAAPGSASQEFIDLFTRIFGVDPESQPYGTVVLSTRHTLGDPSVAEAAVAAARSVHNLTSSVAFDLIYDGQTVPVSVAAGTFATADDLRVHIQTAVDQALVDAGLRLVTDTDDNITVALDADTGAIVFVLGAETGPAAPLNISSRTIEQIQVSLGSGDDVVQLVSGQYDYDVLVNAGPGADTFNIEHGVDMQGHTAVFNGEEGDDLLFANFQEAVPAGTMNVTFNGGPHLSEGDMFRIAGDGATGGGRYRPSSTEPNAGVMNLLGNRLAFTGVEPVVVHGLPDFQVVAPDEAADLTLDSIAVADLNLKNLTLQVVTIDGVVSWTQEDKLTIVNASEPQHLSAKIHANGTTSSAMAVSGNTMVVGAELTNAPYGVVFVYDWNGSQWIERAKLFPDDRFIGGGHGFGDSVAIDGNLMIVGAPSDKTRGTNAGAAYIFEKVDGVWVQQAKLLANGLAANDAFGTAVGIDVSGGGTFAIIGAPGAGNDNNDTAYLFQRSGSTWIERNFALDTSGDLGRAVAIDGGMVAVGAPARAVSSIPGVGVVYVYQIVNNQLSFRTTLTPSNPDAFEAFGSSVAMTSSRIVVGAPGWDGVLDNRADQGRAFVFDGSGSSWTRVARLTADGGLTEADATTDGFAGDRFGAAVSLSGSYVVVGAPGYDAGAGTTGGQTLDSGAAYAFHELADLGSGNGTTWTRATSVNPSGRIEAASPAGTDPNAPQPDRFGAGVAVHYTSGETRVMVGMPGFNDTSGNTIVRPDLGGFRTFKSNNAVPAETLANLRAEILTDGSTTSQFGSRSVYEPNSRTLFVSALEADRVDIYINEGLHWRFVQSLTGSQQFGFDLDVDGNTLVVGEPGNPGIVGRAHVYTRSGEAWVHQQTITNFYEDGFGSSVAVSGNRLVVGSPRASVSYSSDGQPMSGYQLPLGNTGGAYVYQRSGTTWTLNRFLMPDDASLPEATSYSVTSTPASYHSVTISGQTHSGIGRYYLGNSNGTSGTLGPYTSALFIDNTGGDWGAHWRSNPTGSSVSFTLPSSRSNDVDYFWIGSTESNSYGTTASLLRNGSVIATYGYGYHSRSANNETHLRSQAGTIAVAFSTDGFNQGDHQYSQGGYTTPLDNAGRDIEDDVERVWVAGNIAKQVSTPFANTFTGLDGAQWGSSVDIIGTTIVVGAPGESRVAVYDLNDANKGNWTVYAGPFSGRALRSDDYRDRSQFLLGPVRHGESVALASSSNIYAGAPHIDQSIAGPFDIGSVQPYTFNGDTLAARSEIVSPSFQGNGFFGAAESIATRGDRMIVGAPGQRSGGGDAYLYTASSGAYRNLNLRPFTIAGSTTVDDTAAIHFGVGASIISEGFYVVGTQDAEKVYNFRRRGPSFSPISGTDTVSPAALPKPNFGAGVDLDGTTAVVGARDYDGSGAAFVFTTGNSSDWDFQAILQTAGLDVGSLFGAGVAVSGDTIVVGAPGNNAGSGSAFVYQRLGTSWTQTAQFSGVPGAEFGQSVAIDVGTIVVGAPGENAAYFYQLVGGNWTQSLRATGSGRFGDAVAIDGQSAVVGAPNAASATIYTDAGGTWTQQGAALTGLAGSKFGQSVSVSGGSLIVGAPGENASRGAAYTFEQDAGGTWSPANRIARADGAADDFFGHAVSVDGTRAVVGAYGRDLPGKTDVGAAFPYLFKDGAWKPEAVIDPLTGSDAQRGDQVGFAVAISGSIAILGAPQLAGRPGVADTEGAGYAYLRSVSPPINVTVPEVQELLIEGAQANFLRGTIDGTQTARFHFFDIPSVTLQTGSANDHVTIAEPGLTAFGLANFLVKTGDGDDTLTVLSTNLTPPAVGTFLEDGDFAGTDPGDPLPSGASYVEVTGGFSYDGQGGDNSLVAEADADWRLELAKLIAAGGNLALANVESASLIGGPSGNILSAVGWTGDVALDGRGGSDQLSVSASVRSATAHDASGDGDQLQVIGTDADDEFTVQNHYVALGS